MPILAAALPAVLQDAPAPAKKASWIHRLAGRRGLLVLVDGAPGWLLRLEDPFLLDVSAELGVIQIESKDSTALRLGLTRPGAYLLNEAGRALVGWSAGIPQDLRAAFAEAGWRPLETELRDFLRQHPERRDVAHALVVKVWERGLRRMGPSFQEDFAEALESFLSREGWAEGVQTGLPILPLPGSKEDSPLADLAYRRLEVVKVALRKNPRSPLAWELFALLAAWREGEEPRLAPFFQDLVPPPQRFEDLSDWPGPRALALAEAQLRRLGDWKGLEAFAQAKVDQILGRGTELASELPSQWAERFGSGLHHRSPLPLATEASRVLGKWLVLAMEAQLLQDREAQAGQTASLILRDGDEAARREALALARRMKAEGVAKALE